MLFLKIETICAINSIRLFNCGLIAILSLHNYCNVTIAMVFLTLDLFLHTKVAN